MNSPPPPSFTLPPLTSKGQYPVTPEDTPEEDQTAGDYISARAKGKQKAAEHGSEPPLFGADVDVSERISMYVRLFEEMIQTVLASESYLFTAREVWVLRHILGLPYEPMYLMTRLLLRRRGRILSFTNLLPAYEAEIGPEGIRNAIRTLSEPLLVPAEITSSETLEEGSRRSPTPPNSCKPATNPFPTPQSTRKPRTSSSASHTHKRKGTRPWSHLDSGLSAAEEKADPDLAEVLRESLWASQVGRMEIDDDGIVIPSPPPERPAGSRSVSNSSRTSSTSSTPPSTSQTGSKNAKPSIASLAGAAGWDEEFSLDPKSPPPITHLARDERDLDLNEIMSCISAEELRRIAKARKVPANMLLRREDVCAALRGVARKQSVLGFAPVKGTSGQANTDGRGKGRATDAQTTLPFSPATPKRQTSSGSEGGRNVTSESLLIAQLLPLIGAHAIQITDELHDLVSRVNLIFSRTPPLTATSSSLLLPSILVSSHRRRYPDYGPPTRSRIWATREDLLRWERAVHWEAVVQDALGETWQEMRKSGLPMAMGLGGGLKREMLGRVEGSRVVKRIWEGVWPTWLDLVEGKGGDEVDASREEGGLVGDRFKCGHVLTRIVFKSAVALGQLHEYDSEVMVLKALLKQRRWRRSRRGLALVLMNHYNASEEEKIERCREAVQVCIDGLLDEDTHLIYRPALSRRLTRLENKLNLPADERHISHAHLLTCETRELAAPRISENMGQPKVRPMRAGSVREASLGLGEEEGLVGPAGLGAGKASTGAAAWQQTGKSVWLGREGEVTVEGWVLEWWEKKGYKGFHSEGSILTTLFGLLMWPILYEPLPGAFETPYQTAPLDLGEDTFAPARSTLIELRLEAMTKTSAALQLLREVDDRERPRLTWAVGVNWEYGKLDLEELLECIGGRAMSGICRMLAEEYRHRVSGVPDLIVWNYKEKVARFVEVKGPGDSLSETQKIWIDVLLSSGVPVEVCKVKAKDATDGELVKMETSKRKDIKRTAKEEGDKGSKNGWKKVKTKAEVEMQEYVRGDEDEKDEFAYESGDEGKGEGRWETIN